MSMSFKLCSKGNQLATRTADEARRVDEDTPFNTRKLGELVIADTAPLLRECFAALEALCSDRNSLNAPVAPKLIRV